MRDNYITSCVTYRLITAALIIANIYMILKLHDRIMLSVPLKMVENINFTNHVFQSKSPTIRIVKGLSETNLKIIRKSQKAENSSSVQAFTTLHSCKIQNFTWTLPTVPYFIIIGAQKGGTTSMSEWLKGHPDILPGRYPKRKESHFFHGVFAGIVSDRTKGIWNGSDDEFYCLARRRYAEVVFDVPTTMKSMVNGRSSKICFDKTPAYIHLKNCPEYVAKTCPWGVKLLVLLRNPIDRAYSQHEMDILKNHHTFSSFEERLQLEVQKMRRLGLNSMPILPLNATISDIDRLIFPPLNKTNEQEKLTFEKLRGLPLLKKGMYAIQLREWLKWFPQQDIMLVYYEDLKANPDDTYKKVQSFLGIRPLSLKNYSHFHIGKYTKPMSPVTRRYLYRFFEPYNCQLEALWGIKIHDSWKRQPSLTI
jgi:Sulfotransferase domain